MILKNNVSLKSNFLTTPNLMAGNEWLVLVNPNAGTGKGRKDWPVIEAVLKEKKVEYFAVFTERRFHAILLTRKYINEGFRKIIVVGGDGTLNEVINGIFAQNTCMSSEITIGMIPVGTGNDWARMFGIPLDYRKAAEVIMDQKIFLQDAGKVHFSLNNKFFNRYFVNIAGTGFDAIVTQKTNELKEKGKTGKFLYFYNILNSLFKHHSSKITIEVDGRKMRYNIFSLNVGICKFNGGGMMQVPNADPADGLFDITVIRKIGRFSVIRNLGKLYNGSIIHHPKVRSLRGKNISIKAKSPVYLETDGESLGHSPFEFEIIPGSISIIQGKRYA